MPFGPGARLGPYEILAAIGAGGMGEVYRARDTKLNRDVAIKVLLPTVANDPDRLARFSREAQVLASLNHPNIAHIHGLEDVDGVKALVMELVEGATLADRIAQGPIPLDEALPLARQIADALEAAHEQGIIHRDLKPANIKVRPDGTVKVLDFGLAKAMGPAAGSSSSVSMSPTLTSPAMMTGIGMILGTAAYMAPEQARGKAVDKRADIWAFGCVLYEMLTGRRAFEGEDVSVVMASIIKSEPEWNRLPSGTPRAVVATIKRCLRKDPRERLRDIADVRVLLTEADEPSAAAPPGKRQWLPWTAAACGVVAFLALATIHFSETPADAPVMRTSILPPDDANGFAVEANLGGSAISPDGRQLAFVADVGGKRMLYVRSLDSGTSRALPGTGDAARPFWSPDSRNIGFFANGKLQRIGVAEGAPRVICDQALPRGASWNADGMIIFSAARPGVLNRVSASGGTPTPVTTLNVAEHEIYHYWPFFLPDGRHFMYVSRNADADKDAIYIGTLDSQPSDAPRIRLIDSKYGAVFAPSPGSKTAGFIVFVQGANLMAQRFDAANLKMAGEAFSLAQNIGTTDTNGYADVSASQTGVLAYGNEGQSLRRLAWIDREAHISAPISEPAYLRFPRLSSDDRQVVVSATVAGKPPELWQIDLRRSVSTRLTDVADGASSPALAPDGTIAYSTLEKGILRRTATGTRSAADVLVPVPPGSAGSPLDFSDDGSVFLYLFGGQASAQRDIWALPMVNGAPGKSFVYLKGQSYVGGARFAPAVPGQRWVAYSSGESLGAIQVYIQDFPDARTRVQVSRDGGQLPVWSRDGKQLFFLRTPGQMMSVNVAVTGSKIEVDVPKTVFTLQDEEPDSFLEYDVAADGRFLFGIRDQTNRHRDGITVIQNWQNAPAR